MLSGLKVNLNEAFLTPLETCNYITCLPNNNTCHSDVAPGGRGDSTRVSSRVLVKKNLSFQSLANKPVIVSRQILLAPGLEVLTSSDLYFCPPAALKTVCSAS